MRTRRAGARRSRPRLGLIVLLFVRSSRVQRKRAILTIAAIAWGSVSLLLLLAFGEGMKRQLETARAGMGENLAIFWPGETGLPFKGLPAGRPVRPRIDDIALIRERVPMLDAAVGELTNYRVGFTNGRKTVNSRLTGANFEYGAIRNHIARAGGRFLNREDEELKRRVIFLGDELAADLYDKADPVGRVLLVNNLPYTVIGVMTKKMQMGMYGGPDGGHGVIPITAYKAQFGDDKLHNIVLKTRRPEEMSEAIFEVKRVLGARYGFDPEDERAFGVWDTVKSSATMVNILLGIQIFLGVIGGLTLMIGGVGVANIMYAVVKERTREIGVKMALGAKRRWIIMPFVLEAIVYTFIGGALGIIIANLIVAATSFIPIENNKVMSFLGRPTLSPQIGIITSLILGVIGLLAGYFPARRAASVDPAATLRYE